MSAVATRRVNSFPLERPLLRARFRDAQSGNPSLPYFIAGDENRLAQFACQQESDVFALGNPVLLTGAVGAGKTAIALHLAARQAIAMGIAQDVEAVKYLPAIDFAREYAEAANSDDMPPFRKSIDETPILVIDDLQLFADKTAAQEELASRIESRCDSLKPTILTCRRLPSEIRSLRPRLISRSLHGLTIPLSAPGNDARQLILGELAMVHDLSFDADLLVTLADELGSDVTVRGLDAAMKQIALWCRMNDSLPNLDAIRSAVDSTTKNNEISLSRITQSVARIMGLKTVDLRSSSRKQSVVRGRALAMFIARRTTSNSLDQIGKYFGGRDHSTVLHSIRKTESLINEDSDLHQVFNDVVEKISC